MSDLAIPPVCPRCRVACVWEVSTPAVGSGIVTDHTYCPSCRWDPSVDGLRATIEDYLVTAGWKRIEGGWWRGEYRLLFEDAVARQIVCEATQCDRSDG